MLLIQTFHYLGVYNQIIEYELPRLHAHFQHMGIEAQMYAVDWYVNYLDAKEGCGLC